MMSENYEGIISDYISKSLSGLHTAMPGRIISYDVATNTAQVLLGFKRIILDEDPRPYPKISDVPVILPSFGHFSIRPPREALEGETCLIIFAERSMDSWLSSDDGNPVDPIEFRRFSITDAVCIPGLYPDRRVPTKNLPDNQLEISYGKSVIGMTADGKISIKGVDRNQQTVSLVNELVNLIQNLTKATVLTESGPTPSLDAITLQTLNDIKQRLSGIDPDASF